MYSGRCVLTFQMNLLKMEAGSSPEIPYLPATLHVVTSQKTGLHGHWSGEPQLLQQI
jgi:hypothetical protein